jgi:hypothetical protein
VGSKNCVAAPNGIDSDAQFIWTASLGVNDDWIWLRTLRPLRSMLLLEVQRITLEVW